MNDDKFTIIIDENAKFHVPASVLESDTKRRLAQAVAYRMQPNEITCFRYIVKDVPAFSAGTADLKLITNEKHTLHFITVSVDHKLYKQIEYQYQEHWRDLLKMAKALIRKRWKK